VVSAQPIKKFKPGKFTNGIKPGCSQACEDEVVLIFNRLKLEGGSS